jgi:hypothetical protein
VSIYLTIEAALVRLHTKATMDNVSSASLIGPVTSLSFSGAAHGLTQRFQQQTSEEKRGKSAAKNKAKRERTKKRKADEKAAAAVPAPAGKSKSPPFPKCHSQSSRF